MDDIRAAAEQVFRRESGLILAGLIRISGSFDRAEEGGNFDRDEWRRVGVLLLRIARRADARRTEADEHALGQSLRA